MKDIDFDELDRAVSSVLGTASQPTETEKSADTTAPVGDPVALSNTPQAATVQPDDAQIPAEATTATGVPSLEDEVLGTSQTNETPDIADSTQPEASLVPEMNVSAPEATTPLESTSDVTESPANNAPAMRRGKFMDVVHPSADMNPAAAPTSGTAVGHRVITPINSDVKPEELPDPKEAEEEVNPLSSTVSQVESTTIPNAPDPAEQPLPVDNQTVLSVDETTEPEINSEPNAKDPIAESAEMAPATEVADEADTATITIPADETPTQSPFLPDAKVEKRPLGGLGQPAIDPALAEDMPVEETPTDFTPNQPQPVEPTPRELEDDVVSRENTSEPEEVDATVPLSAQPEPVTIGVAPEDMTNTSGSQPLFGSEEPQQPLSDNHPAKKGGSHLLWWIAGLLGCLLVGGAVGAFLFLGGF